MTDQTRAARESGWIAGHHEAYLEDGAAASNFGLGLPAEDWPTPRSNPRRHEPLAASLRDSCRRFIG